MKKISPYSLWLGHGQDARDFKAIMDAGIEAIVQAAIEEPALQPPRDLLYLRFPLIDGPDNPVRLLAFAIQNVATLIRFSVPTLVCCNAGLSRSPAIAAAAISIAERRLGDEDAILCELSRQYHCDVAPGLWNNVKEALAFNKP